MYLKNQMLESFNENRKQIAQILLRLFFNFREKNHRKLSYYGHE